MNGGVARPATGLERAALVLLALGETHGAAIWKEFSDEEIAALGQAISRLGSVASSHMGAALTLFSDELASRAGLAGTPDMTEGLIRKVLPEDRAAPIVARIRRPSGPDLWERLATLDDRVISDFLNTQHDQTVALILSRLPSPRAAAIMCLLSPERAVAVLGRFARLADADREASTILEQTLAVALIEPAATANRRDSATDIAAIFDSIDQKQADQLLQRWSARDGDTAKRVRELMFTFDDFQRSPPTAIQGVLRVLDRDLLAIALKGAAEQVRTHFLDQMSARASRMLEDQMASRGPLRRKDVIAAQAKVIATARELEQAGEITLRPPSETNQEEMIE